jgi:RNA polymerase sigma-54 factor
MTPQLRQAIKLLQFSNIEVAAFLEEELERNPLLERDEVGEFAPMERPAPDQIAVQPTNGELDAAVVACADVLTAEAASPLDVEHAETYDPGGIADGALLTSLHSARAGSPRFDGDERPIDEYIEDRRSLQEYLGEQLRLSFSDPVDRLIGAYLIALLHPSGRLSVRPEALAHAMGTDAERIEAVRAKMMRLEPVGMFALDLRECLAAQLAELDRLDPAMQSLLNNLELLARRDMKRLAQICGVDAADLADMVAELRRLDPKPGAMFDAAPVQPLQPDVLMRPAPDGGWLLELNPDTMPRILVNQTFSARVLPHASKNDRAFLAEKLQSANWLVKSLQQRAQTILKVAAEIVTQQDAFFRHGVSHLRPLILRDIADAVEMHESTVSRVTAGKYIATPRGTFELKYFFTTAIAGTSGESHSAESVRHRIRAMVAREAPDEILSDDAIVAILRREGVDIARRTVAKYREALRIPSSVQRKREKAVPA